MSENQPPSQSLNEQGQAADGADAAATVPATNSAGSPQHIEQTDSTGLGETIIPQHRGPADPSRTCVADVDFSKWTPEPGEELHPGRTLTRLRPFSSPSAKLEPPARLDESPSNDPTAAARNAGFVVETVLGEGGMGTVYAGRQQSMDRPVAIKVLKGEGAGSKETHQLFVSEAIITGSLDHPNIVPIYEVGGEEENTPFYAMKQVKGTEWTEKFSSNGIDENLEILLRVCDGIRFAHERGIIHRDLKPANIMLGAFGEVLVMDWGLAIPAPENPQRAKFPPASLGGTPHYMAPEMILDVRSIDRRSDVYLLGGILFAIMAGRAPHALDDPQAEIRDHLTRSYEAVSRNLIAETDANGELFDIAMKALATNQDDRYQSVADFQSAIREYLAHEESIELSERSLERLARATSESDYASFSRAQFGFETALDQWPENWRAIDGLKRTAHAYAKTAYNRGDYDLALSLIDVDDSELAPLANSIRSAVRERESKQRQVTILRRASLAAVGLVALISTGAAVWINSERTKALEAKTAESKQREIAVAEREHAVEAKQRAEASERDAVVARRAAEVSEQDAITARRAAEDSERIAKRDRDAAERQAYYSDMLLLRQSVADDNTLQIREILGRHEHQAKLRGFEFDYWNRQVDSAIFSTKRSPAAIRCVAFSPNGQWIAAPRWGDILLRHTRSPNDFAVLGRCNGEILDLAFSPDGKLIAAAGHDNVVRVWDVETRQQVIQLDTDKGWQTGVAFSPDGAYIASVSFNKLAIVWNVRTGERVSQFEADKNGCRGLCFHPDGKYLATAGSSGTVTISDWMTGETQLSFRASSTAVHRLRFSPDGKVIATANEAGNVGLWSLDSGSQVALLRGHTAAIRDLSFASDGSHLVSVGEDRTVKRWDVASASLQSTWLGHSDRVQAVAVSPDGTLIASGGNGLELWAALNTQPVRTIPIAKANLTKTSVSPNGRFAICGTTDGMIMSVDLASGRVVNRSKEFWNRVQDVVISPDGRKLAASASSNATQFGKKVAGSVKVWDVQQNADGVLLKNGTKWHEFPKGVSRLAFAPDSQRLATANYNKTVSVFDVDSGSKQFDCRGHTGMVLDVKYDPQDRYIVSVGTDRQIRLWDSTTGEQLEEVLSDQGWIRSCEVSPDGTRLATADWLGQIATWSMPDAEPLTDRVMHTGNVYAITYSPNGRRVATASKDGSVKVWDPTTGQETLAFYLNAEVNDLTFASDGRQLIATLPSAIKIWDSSPNDVGYQNHTRAAGYLTVHAAQAPSLEALNEKIAQDKTISAEVRAIAEGLAESFWAKSAE